jgi:HD superfamily phosphohydrolase YqeK
LDACLRQLAEGFAFTGSVPADAPAFLVCHGHAATAQHSAGVAVEAGRISGLLYPSDDPLAQAAVQAAWLHDISAVFPGPQRADVADALGIDVLPEERVYPPILHQKLSAILARELFGVIDKAVLDAIACHTTLREHATVLDQIVFLADKLAWDQPGAPPYRDAIAAALSCAEPDCGQGRLRTPVAEPATPGATGCQLGSPPRRLDAATLAYLDYVWLRRNSLPVIHPWMRGAHDDLSCRAMQPRRCPAARSDEGGIVPCQ